ncbi:hypothetical protein, partial [Pusillimonas sp. T2]|uniref:hypothetical protein n=1 Tax=Pusillimonas sp. T2 TaxID=1548123 RepID=UPI001C1F6542
CQSGAWKGSNTVVATGMISHGQQIPLPLGKTQQLCKWLVSSGTNYHGNYPDHFGGQFALADNNRIVSCGYRDYWPSTNGFIYNGTCQYIIICE